MRYVLQLFSSCSICAHNVVYSLYCVCINTCMSTVYETSLLPSLQNLCYSDHAVVQSTLSPSLSLSLSSVPSPLSFPPPCSPPISPSHPPPASLSSSFSDPVAEWDFHSGTYRCYWGHLASVPTEASLVIQMCVCVCVCVRGGGGALLYMHMYIPTDCPQWWTAPSVVSTREPRDIAVCREDTENLNALQRPTHTLTPSSVNIQNRSKTTCVMVCIELYVTGENSLSH